MTGTLPRDKFSTTFLESMLLQPSAKFDGQFCSHKKNTICIVFRNIGRTANEVRIQCFQFSLAF